MKSFSYTLNLALLPAALTSARFVGSAWTEPSCLGNCMPDLGSSWWSAGPSVLCNSTTIDTVNSCVAASSCSASDKQAAYQNFASACAAAGYSVTATPEATYSVSVASTTASAGGPWGPFGSGGPGSWGPGGGGPFGGGNGEGGPFGPGGWGPWASGTSWASGAYTSWWGGSDCPPSTWTGWTEGPWSTGAPWTTWTACAQTTATGVVTTTVTTGASSTVVTTTEARVQVAEATASPTSAGEKREVAAAGAVFAGFVAAVLAM